MGHYDTRKQFGVPPRFAASFDTACLGLPRPKWANAYPVDTRHASIRLLGPSAAPLCFSFFPGNALNPMAF